MKKALGKGLSALIPDTYKNEIEAEKAPKPPAENEPKQSVAEENKNGFQMVSLTKIVANEDQPRKDFSAEAIDELAASIKEKGILQPLVVKQTEGGKYMIVCGERRFRASKLCGLKEIPVIIKEVASGEILEWALIENIQREDLNPLEEAEAYKRLSEERKLSQEEIAKRVGKDRTTIANMMRLLKLPAEVRVYVSEGRLMGGHARALLTLITPEHQRQLAKKIVEENLSVRQVEAIVTRSVGQKRRAKKARHLAPEIVDLENRLIEILGTQVKIHPRKNKDQGRVELHYFSLDDLDRILGKLGLKRS